MNKLKDQLNFFVYEGEVDYFDLDKGEAKAILEELEKLDKLKDYLENHNIRYDLAGEDMLKIIEGDE